MEQKRIDIKEMIKFAFNSIVNDLGLWLLVDLSAYVAIAIAIVAIFLAFLILPMSLLLFPTVFFGCTLLFLVLMAITGIITLGTTQISLDFYDHHTSALNRLWSAQHLLLKYLVASYLYTLMVLFGLMLFIIPGIVFALQFSLYIPIMVDRNLGPIDALKESLRITKGHLLQLFAVAIIIVIIFAIPIIGALFGSIASSLFAVYIYRKLSGNS